MIRRPPRSTRTDTLFPYTTLFRSHEIFGREGNDLHCSVPISVVTAALGGELEVPTLEGKIEVDVPEGSQSGKQFRLRGRGVRRSEEHTSELQSLMRISYAVFCLKKKTRITTQEHHNQTNTTN